MPIKERNQICSVANSIYGHILKYEKTFNTNQDIQDLKYIIEQSVGPAKYSADKLRAFKQKMEGNFKMDKFFDENIDYAKELREADHYTLLDIKRKYSKPDDSWAFKYRINHHYQQAYHLAHKIKESLSDSELDLWEYVVRSVERGYYLSYRICRKLEEYRKKYPEHEIWNKRKSKLTDFEKFKDKFKRNSIKRHEKNLKPSKYIL